MNIQKHILVIFCALIFSLPVTASAATISLIATPANVGVGDTVRVDVLLDSDIPTNAFSGTISYLGEVLEPIAISDGNSIVSLWITHPKVPIIGTSIAFAGITPGGFSGNAGVLFSILFKAKATGEADVSIGDREVLRNDGTGGRESVTVEQLTLSIGSKSFGGYTEPEDTTPPEPFTAYLNTDPQLFEGKSYLSFMAVDKSSGVDHYAVAESRVPSFLFFLFTPSWNETTSPYVLVNQNLTSKVYIKAVDRAGNERLSVYPPQHLLTVYEMTVLLVILTVVVFLWQSRWGRRLRLNP